MNTYDYKKNVPTYKASIVDLTLAAQASLNNIDESTMFGKEFHILAGSQIKTFLDMIVKMYDVCNISNPHSSDYRTSYNFWFLETPIKRRVKYAELHLDNAVHKLNLLLNVLIIQLRWKYEYITKNHVDSEYSTLLISELDKVLTFLPVQKEKDIVITDKNEQMSEDGTVPIKTITITYEPFIDHVNASFNEASKLKRINMNKEDKPTETKKRVEFKKVDTKKVVKNKKNKNVSVDEDGWKVVKGKK
jgi:hypothetical protein